MTTTEIKAVTPEAVNEWIASTKTFFLIHTLPNYQIGGNLELRGITAPLAFSANLFQLEDDSIGADAHFDFDRTRWGSIYGASRFFKHLGMHVIYDLISVQLKLRLVPV